MSPIFRTLGLVGVTVKSDATASARHSNRSPSLHDIGRLTARWWQWLYSFDNASDYSHGETQSCTPFTTNVPLLVTEPGLGPPVPGQPLRPGPTA